MKGNKTLWQNCTQFCKEIFGLNANKDWAGGRKTKIKRVMPKGWAMGTRDFCIGQDEPLTPWAQHSWEVEKRQKQ